MPQRPVVLITGAARRLGRAIALDLAAHGYDVALHYRNSVDAAQDCAERARELGAAAAIFGADLTDETATRALVPAVRERFGRIDAVVNNASDFEYDDARTFGYATLQRQLAANTAPAVVLSRALFVAAEELKSSGCVVNLLDQKLWNPNPDYLSYTLSKAALHAATTSLALALAPRVRVCAVAPGITLASGPMDEAEFERAHRMTPLQRGATPVDVARSVRFLIESPAITGHTLLVDGGQHLQHQPRDVMFLARDGDPR